MVDDILVGQLTMDCVAMDETTVMLVTMSVSMVGDGFLLSVYSIGPQTAESSHHLP